MKKINRKGYLTVEIILASSIAFVIAVFLIDLTIKLSNKTDDAYLDTILTTDKAIITNKIMMDIKTKKLVNVVAREVSSLPLLLFEYANGEVKELSFDKEHKKLIYGDYQKEYKVSFDEVSLDVNEYIIDEITYFNIKLTLKNIYSDSDYGFNITVSKSNDN